MNLNEQTVLKAFSDKGYKFFNSPYSINIYGIRMSTGTNKFDDYVCVAYYDDRECFMNHVYLGTTEPGLHWLKNPMRRSGCAIMVPGQYRSAYKIGPHGRTRYTACRQCKEIPVYRDNNKDSVHDFDDNTVETGLFYTNIHHGWGASLVGRNSAGCIVIQSKHKFNKHFMPIVKKSCELYGPEFTFTLFNKSDFES